MTRSVRLILVLLVVTLLLPLSQPSHAQDQTAFMSASVRYGFMAPTSWVGTHRPTVGLQFGVPSESVTLASSQASLDVFVRGAASFMFEEYDFDFSEFTGAAIAATLWPAGLDDDVYLDDYDLRYGLEYINDEYGGVNQQDVVLGPFSGTHFSREWRGLNFHYYWLTNVNGEVLLMAVLNDATHAELTAAILDGIVYNTFSAEDLANPYGDPVQLTLNGGVQVTVPLGWWSLGAVQDQYLTILGPNPDLLRATSFPNSSAALTTEGVVVGAYRWASEPDTDWTTAAGQALGIDLTLTSIEPIPLVNGQSTIILEATLPDYWGSYTVGGRGIVWEGEGEVTALLALGFGDHLAAYEANINAIFASAQPPVRAVSDAVQTVKPASGRYAMEVPSEWIQKSGGEVLGFNFTGVFPHDGLMIASNADTLAFMGDTILASWDFVSYDAVPSDIGVLVGTVLPAEVLALVGFDADSFESQLLEDGADEFEVIPLELRGLTGNRYHTVLDGVTQASYIMLQDGAGNLYFFVLAATGRDYERFLAALETMRIEPSDSLTAYELAPKALEVDVPAGWWGGEAQVQDYLDQRVPVVSSNPVLIGALTLGEPEDWEYDLPLLQVSQLQGLVFGGMTFTDLSGIQALVGADGSIDTGALAELAVAQLGQESETLVVGDISEWSNANGLAGTQLEFDLTLSFELETGNGSVDVHGMVIGVQVPQGLAVMVALTSADQLEANRAVIDDVFNSARLK